MKGCRHGIVANLRWFGGSWMRTCDCDDHAITADARRCKCGEWLPMGKATDTPATAIEVRAAELAQTRSSESLMEWAGWQCHADDFPPNTGSAQAGWLAREIAFHEDPTP